MGDAGGVGVIRVGIDSAEGDKAFAPSSRFPAAVKGFLHFVADTLGNLVSGNGDVANPETVFFDEDEIRRPCAHVDDQGAFVRLEFAVAKGVEQREGRDVDLEDLDPQRARRLRLRPR